MNKTTRSAFTLALLLGAGALSAPQVQAQIAPAIAQAPAGEARDRAAIEAMAGTFKVTFDFRETTPFAADYQPIAPKVVSGHEVVRVVEEGPGHVVLQHLLVAGDEGSIPEVVKHWRQDWTYEPASVLVYTAPGRWTVSPVAEAERKGAWSQTVWQTDDSPRYGAIGHWVYDDGVARWMSQETRRPLARRDATRHPVYDHYIGTNRHALTPTGWVQEQDNAKIGQKDGQSVTFVHEVVTNTYARTSDFPVQAADDYWAKTKDYWATVRAAWAETIAKQGGVAVTEVADSGASTAEVLMGLGDDIAAGKTKTPDAIAKAKALIAKTGEAG